MSPFRLGLPKDRGLFAFSTSNQDIHILFRVGPVKSEIGAVHDGTYIIWH